MWFLMFMSGNKSHPVEETENVPEPLGNPKFKPAKYGDTYWINWNLLQLEGIWEMFWRICMYLRSKGKRFQGEMYKGH